MHRSTATLIAIIVCCLSLLSIVSAQCGPGLGSCSDGNCCSAAGFCGVGPLYCGPGCQTGFGAPCNDGGAVSPSASSLPATSPLTPPPVSSTTVSVAPTLTTNSPSTVILTTTIATTTDAASTTTQSTSTSNRGTFQLQPTGKPSSGFQTKSGGVESRLALVIVFLAGYFII
ncbi:hypothetical protein FBU30_006628 [Linnemannia zychae]|nr:hypothetical protein FBU30_006628 [Linnemannia zychae]